MENSSDVKELIPEFYSGQGDFLVNSEGLDFGLLQNGVRILSVSKLSERTFHLTVDGAMHCDALREDIASDSVLKAFHLNLVRKDSQFFPS